MPNLVVIAGPNGAGKSTLAPALLHGLLGLDSFVNADVIARGLSGFDPDRAAIQAGRIMLQRLDELAEAREDFAFETTLASRTFAPWIGDLIASGYTPEHALAEIGAAVEGYRTAKSAYALAQRVGVEMPIVTTVYRILYEGVKLSVALQMLLERDPRPENY